jgi:hypothetical protein
LKQLLTRKNVVGSQRASVDAALAYWEMFPNAADEDVADGRQRMQEAADFYEKQPSEYSKEKLIWTYLSWANPRATQENAPFHFKPPNPRTQLEWSRFLSAQAGS